jgi:predicted PurR-regulated permease PerM
MSDIRSIRITNDTFIRGILFIAVAYIFFQLTDIFLLIIVSIVIASFVEAGVQLFARYNVRRIMAVPIIFMVVTLLLTAIFYAFLPVVFRELSGMIRLLMDYLPANENISSESIQGATEFVSNITKHATLNDLFVNLRNASGTLTQGATSFLGSTFSGILNIILVVVMSFYLSIQEKGIENFLRILTPLKHEKYVIDLWGRTQRKIGLWFKGQLLLGFIVGTITFIVLFFLKVKYAFLLGIVSGISELVPFGIIFAAVPAILFAVIDGGVGLGLYVLIYYVFIQQIENYILSPVVARRIVGIPPLVVLLAFLIGITLAGFWGAIIAMPVAVFVLEYLSDVEKRKLVPIETNTPK